MRKRRNTFEDRAVMPYMEKGESYADAKRRLDRLWQLGQHPVQLKEAAKHGSR